jgi:SAM-dependent methyltransferase
VSVPGKALESLRLAALFEFVRSWLPAPPARVLEVGCGSGELSLAIEEVGYDVVGIDPAAPEGPSFRRTRLENFADERGFDAVVASVSLHHVEDVPAAVEKVAALVRPAGVLVIEEWARERFTGATAEWYYHQRRALSAVGLGESHIDEDFDVWLPRWHEEHSDVHPLAELRRELDGGFRQLYAGWVPYLYDYSLRDSAEPLERDLIEAGAIEPTGFRYVGERP